MRALVVAGTQSGVGKTSVSIGIMAALRRRGLVVQPFKVGPDFIDPSHHRRAAGCISRNLDGWMLSRETNQRIFYEHARAADVAVIEGVMGLFDGRDGRSENGSTAEMAKWLGAPVLLVVDAWAMARSAAAVILGYTRFDPDVRIVGVIFNKVGSETHLRWLQEAVERTCQVPVLAGLPNVPEVSVPERHLGLLMSEEDRLPGAYIDKLADLVAEHLDLDRLLTISEMPGSVAAEVVESTPGLAGTGAARPRASIGVIRDEAFCFYYQDNLELLQSFGAELVQFSALRDRLPGNICGLYIGGGYPELYAKQLSANGELLREIREFAARGGVIYGECGGLMYLSQGIEVSAGKRFPMCAVLPFWTRMVPTLKLAYAEVATQPQSAVFPAGQMARGHLFHCSEVVGHHDVACCYEVRGAGWERWQEGFQIANTLASYVHVHFASNPAFAESLVRACAKRQRREGA